MSLKNNLWLWDCSWLGVEQDGEHSGKAEVEGAGLCLHLQEHRLPLQRCQFENVFLTIYRLWPFLVKIVSDYYTELMARCPDGKMEPEVIMAITTMAVWKWLIKQLNSSGAHFDVWVWDVAVVTLYASFDSPAIMIDAELMKFPSSNIDKSSTFKLKGVQEDLPTCLPRETGRQTGPAGGQGRKRFFL